MNAKTMSTSALFVIGGVVFSVAHAQSAAETATISATGAIANSNGWISSVTVNNTASPSGNNETRYVLNFSGAAPVATSCNVTPAISSLNSRIINPVSMPNMLVISFTPSGPNEGVANAAATDFTLSCAAAATAMPNPAPPAATMTTTTTTRTTTTTPAMLQGTQTASISSTAAITNNNGWISSVTFTGPTGYPPNAYIVEFAGKSPGASNCQVSPATTTINGYTFTPGLFDGSDGTSVMVRYVPAPGVPSSPTMQVATGFAITCSFPSA